jgi:dimeric dUTPase (all-alpha-NTP-PPase superfamily)
MEIANQIIEMLSMQDRLNTLTNGKRWKQGINDSGRTIDWVPCITQEAAEAMDSLPWKHWKDVRGSVDLENLKTELVDIWHFLLSEALVHIDRNLKGKMAGKTREPEHRRKARNVMIGSVAKRLASQSEILWFFEEERFNHEAAAGELDREVGKAAKRIRKFQYVTLAYEFAYFKEDLEELYNVTEEFFSLCAYFQMPFGEIRRRYVAKNVLNHFRQDKGYKEGGYIKQGWGENGDLEDNGFVEKILAVKPDIEAEELYHLLQEAYPGSEQE